MAWTVAEIRQAVKSLARYSVAGPNIAFIYGHTLLDIFAELGRKDLTDSAGNPIEPDAFYRCSKEGIFAVQ
jgi:hypothetical protein